MVKDKKKPGAGGKRPGSGRPKGRRNDDTLVRLHVLAKYRQRVLRVADRLLNSQLHLAQERKFLYKIEKEKIIGPKGGVSYKPKKPVVVESETEIQQWLEGKLREHDLDAAPSPKDPGATYYYLTVKDGEPNVIKDMYDRTFGSSVQISKIVDDEEKAVQPLFVGGLSENQIDEYLTSKLSRSTQDPRGK